MLQTFEADMGEVGKKNLYYLEHEGVRYWNLSKTWNVETKLATRKDSKLCQETFGGEILCYSIIKTSEEGRFRHPYERGSYMVWDNFRLAMSIYGVREATKWWRMS